MVLVITGTAAAAPTAAEPAAEMLPPMMFIFRPSSAATRTVPVATTLGQFESGQVLAASLAEQPMYALVVTL